jgi:hypothetical protein
VATKVAATGTAAHARKGMIAFVAAAQAGRCPTLRPEGTNARGVRPARLPR